MEFIKAWMCRDGYWAPLLVRPADIRRLLVLPISAEQAWAVHGDVESFARVRLSDRLCETMEEAEAEMESLARAIIGELVLPDTEQ
jgi:hypothetical protein